MISLQSKFIGSMLGSAIGDAIGELAFFYPEKGSLDEILKRIEKLIYTDDTAMALGLAESLIQKKCVDQKHLGDTFSRNFFLEPWRGYASGPPQIFFIVREKGISYVEAAKSLFGGKGSFGNGAAMRVAPLGLLYYKSNSIYQNASLSAEVTHAHPVGMDGAAVQAFAVAQAVKLNPDKEFPLEEFIQNLINFSKTSEIKEKMELLKSLIIEKVSPKEAHDLLGKSVSVDESLPFAIYSFLRNPKSFENCLFCSILNGGDRDTLGAMACAISGAYLGVEAIPLSWRNKIENKEMIEKFAQAILQIIENELGGD
jgi:poly(ADP-ribose) glycohydrolase ARH3